MELTELVSFAKSKGIFQQSSDIYGGLAGFFDFGPNGVELKKKLIDNWWRFHVKLREDCVGVEGSIITNPKVWKASGHVDNFEDLLVQDEKTKEMIRADHLIEELLGIQVEGKNPEEIDKIIEENNLLSSQGNKLSKVYQFNLMFKTNVGPISVDTSYLRPETCQLIFVNFKDTMISARKSIPFGICQVGKAFRNEIAPRNSLFRAREFEQMELEYFVDPKKEPQNIDWFKDEVLMLIKDGTSQKITFETGIKTGVFKNLWLTYRISEELKWWKQLGVSLENIRIRQHLTDELAHYSSDCWDVEYNFPWGWKEVQGIADRGNYDLTVHSESSKKDLSVFDEETKKKFLPSVIEPSAGVGRVILALLFDGLKEREDHKVLKINPNLAPVTVAVFPLIKKKSIEAKKIYEDLKEHFDVQFDESGSVGRRYARADEIGVPYCVTVDFEEGVTIRSRDTTKQIRVKEENLVKELKDLVLGEKNF